jgi:hypothetical protein
MSDISHMLPVSPLEIWQICPDYAGTIAAAATAAAAQLRLAHVCCQPTAGFSA